jgi:hypothetical protein
LFLFLDGVGLGVNDPKTNPLAAARMPNLFGLLGGHPLTRETAPYTGTRATLLALDAGLGVQGLPQSATGQATLLTGRNIPAEIGYHYGPKPNEAVARALHADTVFNWSARAELRSTLLNAYPPRYFQGILSGRRLYSSIPLAATNAGLQLMTRQDLLDGRALSADFTGSGWRTMLHLVDTPVMNERTAGSRLAALARDHDFSLFEYWASDYAGHKQDMTQAIALMESFDTVLGGLLETWTDGDGLILLTSDHGNMEDLSTRRHTAAPVPALIIGERNRRQKFAAGLHDLTGIAPSLWREISRRRRADPSL